MLELNVDDDHLPRVADFYHGKTVFITGATGFVGSVILELLLRCCPGIEAIYILIRPRKDKKPDDRKEQIFNKKIFDRLKEENKELLNKVHVISGDIKQPNLGMSKEDIQLLIEKTSVVFHCAANIQLTNPLNIMLTLIFLSLNSIIELCRKMKKLEALVYTSTAYSNCNRPTNLIKEEIYRMPFPAEKFLIALKNNDNEKLQEMAAFCKPDWPNTYTFSKSMAENLIADTASDLPVAIIRPSIVMSTLKNPVPCGKGVIKVLHGDKNSKMNLVPVDIVANAHILVACYIGTKRCASPPVFNCTASEKLHIKIGEYIEILNNMFLEFPLPQAFSEYVGCSIHSNKYLYYIARMYHHQLPAFVLDVILKISGKKPKLCSLYSFFDLVVEPLHYFMSATFNFERNNVQALDKLIHPEDRKDLSLDFEDVTFQDMASKLPQSTLYFDWKLDKKSPSERQRIKYRRHMMITSIRWTFVIFLFIFISWIFYMVFY
ncbi:fatty acyl-CoA reductase 1-like isoform X2 [Argiope bruennichi]|uniref:fatty acyl-CoA reductase 1-like isoform X2 n=1 Tax=Argiope bruennichi TaxID=94029 RepID=UPI002494F952|nr:fatty acyl-CoA reductase 1-like isoform X2 [Argiope bruennichi]